MLRAGRWCEPARRKCWIYILLWKIEDSINTSAWSNMLLVVHDVISSSCWNVACKATFLWSWCLKHSWKWQIIGFNGLSSNIEFLLPFRIFLSFYYWKRHQACILLLKSILISPVTQVSFPLLSSQSGWLWELSAPLSGIGFQLCCLLCFACFTSSYARWINTGTFHKNDVPMQVRGKGQNIETTCLSNT